MKGDDPADRAGESACAAEAPLFDKGAYFIGKAVWGKGYSELLDRLADQKAVLDGVPMPIDIYGTGEDLDEACLIPLYPSLHMLCPVPFVLRHVPLPPCALPCALC